ncbi:MAG: tetratricopeptide repeat protein, partial [Parcubacteria group bacterium]|nr:tetratricopeptide repeat protein [Parcubacteria group bacterium]
FLKNIFAVPLYFGKIFFFRNLAVFPILSGAIIWFGVAAFFIFIFFISAFWRGQWKKILFGIIWFLLFLIPAILKPDFTRASDFLEHRLYLPIIGILFVLASLHYEKLKIISARARSVLCGLFIIFLGITTIVYARDFRDRLAFWQAAVRDAPLSAFTRNNLGSMYYLEGFKDNALNEWLKAVQLDPNERLVHGNLGLLYTERERFAEAEEEFKKEIELNPLYDNAYYQLGLLYYQQGKTEEALSLWRKTLEINPSYQGAYINLIIHYYKNGDAGLARAYTNAARMRNIAIPSQVARMVYF